MIYLASPYTHPDPKVRRARHQAACVRTASMLQAGQLVHSPIVYGHALAELGLPGDWSFWEPHARAMLGRATSVQVLALPGWRESVGVCAEMRIARELGLPVEVVEP